MKKHLKRLKSPLQLKKHPVEEAKAEETDEEAVEEAKDEEVTEEAKEEVEESEEKVDESKLEKAPEADKADHADNKASPVAKGQKGGMKISKSEETGASVPRQQIWAVLQSPT